MEENLKIELQRAKMSNYILKKQNEMLMGTIGNLSKEKENLIKQIEIYKQNSNNSFGKRIIGKVKKIIRR